MTIAESAGERGGAPLRTAFRVVAAVLCAAGMVTALIAYRSERRLDEFKSLARSSFSLGSGIPTDQGRPTRVQREALRVLPSARPLNPDTELEVHRALFLEPDDRKAEAVLRSALRREPENVRLWLALSNTQVRGDRLASARRSYARARELNPRLPRPR